MLAGNCEWVIAEAGGKERRVTKMGVDVGLSVEPPSGLGVGRCFHEYRPAAMQHGDPSNGGGVAAGDVAPADHFVAHQRADPSGEFGRHGRRNSDPVVVSAPIHPGVRALTRTLVRFDVGRSSTIDLSLQVSRQPGHDGSHLRPRPCCIELHEGAKTERPEDCVVDLITELFPCFERDVARMTIAGKES